VGLRTAAFWVVLNADSAAKLMPWLVFVPDKATCCGLPPPLSLTETAPLKVPRLCELKRTVMVQDPLGCTLDPQLLVSESSCCRGQTEQPVETQFTLSDQWSRRLFTALCRRYGLEPYRYRRQRHTTVVVRAPRSFINNTLWPEFLQIKDALDEYLNEATERIIREEVYGNSAEAPERAE
jgi:hypothetical protein